MPAALLPLSVRGNNIVDSRGGTVRLRGTCVCQQFAARPLQ
jgi:hypothetical protein